MARRSRLGPGLFLGAFLLVAAGCGDGGEQRSFVSNKIEAVPTNVSGTGNTAGISAGAALSVSSSTTPGVTVTPTPTSTPAPSK